MRRCSQRGKPLQADQVSNFTKFSDLHLSPVLFSIGPFDLRPLIAMQLPQGVSRELRRFDFFGREFVVVVV